MSCPSEMQVTRLVELLESKTRVAELVSCARQDWSALTQSERRSAKFSPVCGKLRQHWWLCKERLTLEVELGVTLVVRALT
eukprot:6403272-Amphidinium_carterae.3